MGRYIFLFLYIAFGLYCDSSQTHDSEIAHASPPSSAIDPLLIDQSSAYSLANFKQFIPGSSNREVINKGLDGDLFYPENGISSHEYPIVTPVQNMDVPSPIQVFPKQKRNPLIAAGLSLLVFPGLGHYYLDDMVTGSLALANSLLACSLAITSSADTPEFAASSIYLQTTVFYSVYSAYRDAITLNGISNYSYKMPDEKLASLAYAPFQFSVIKKPEVWGGLLGFLSLASAISYYTSGRNFQASSYHLTPMLALPVAIGEESFFRGFLQSAISEYVNPTVGLVVSSLVFGAAHIPNALAFDSSTQRRNYYTFSIPFLTVAGFYLGCLAQKNHSLKESVALHMWYDFILFASDVIASKYSNSAKPPQFNMALKF